MSKRISATLDVESLKSAVRELRTYKAQIERKVNTLIERMCKYGEQYAFSQSQNAVSDGDENLSVSVVGYREGDKGIILAGGDAVFVEFGAGVYFNGAAGSSPHPKGEQLGMTIGSYGLGQGANPQGWYWMEGDRVCHSRGTQANMFLYRTARVIAQLAPTMAQKIFNE